MHWARLAPELSATVTMVRSWIMAGSPRRSSRALHDSHEAPPLVLRQRTRLGEPDDVADVTLVLLVVHLELLPAPHVSADRRMLHQTLDRDHDGLVHPV